MSDKSTGQAISGEKEELQFSSFYLSDTLCGIEIDLVQEISDNLIITAVPLSSDYVVGIMNLRGQIITIIDLCLKIGFNPVDLTDANRIIIVRSKNENIGLLVERVTEVISADSADLMQPPSNVKGMQGKYIRNVLQTGENEIMAHLDLGAVLEGE